ncbi:ty3-gypsy retrotransposon protein [Tanacetum coccineum]
MFPRIYALEINKDCTVADKLQFSVTSSLRRSVRGGVESSQLALLQTHIEGTLLSNMDDRWVWDLNGEGVFRVKDGRILLDECFLPKAPTATRWVKYVPIKINVFAWKVFLDRLPTRSNLQHRGVLVSDLLCPLCSSAQEDSSHLFFSCRLATDIVRLVCRWWNLSWTPLGSYADWLNWFNSIRLSSKVKDLLEGVLYITWWSVWMFRNQLLFSSKAPRKDVIFDDIAAKLGRSGGGDQASTIPRAMRLDVSKFSGTDPKRWVFSITEYFALLDTPVDQRIKVVGFNLEGDAAEWFCWMSHNGLITTWDNFLESVQHRFGPCKYEDPQGALSKLLQTGTVAQYQYEFEKLMNRRELLVSKPISLGDAFSLARVTEARLDDQGVTATTRRSLTTSAPQILSKSGPGFGAPRIDSPKSALLPTPPKVGVNSRSTPLPIKWISLAERQEQLSKGLCFNCDNKWVHRHKCLGKFFLLMANDEDGVEQPEGEWDDVVKSGDMSILNSLVGHGNPRSLQLWGAIGTSKVHILIDNGSTHNFVQPGVVERMQLPITGLRMEVDLYVLPVKGPDIVLGIQWLQRLGKRISLHHMRALLGADDIYGIYELYNLEHAMEGRDNTEAVESITHPALEPLLVRFESLFQKGEMEKLVGEMLSQGIIRVSHSPFSSPVLLVKKKDGSYRFCVDYRALNEVTVKDKFPIPTADEMFNELGGTVFLGLAGYYRQFIKDYATVAAPLSDLLQKHGFKWEELERKAFNELKDKLTNALILGLPDFNDTFVIEADASAVGIGAVLLQRGRPLSYFSRKLGPRMRVAATYQEELFAIVEAVYKWRQYLIGRRFTIRTDHRSIKELMQKVIQMPLQQKYVRKLMGFDFNIEYKPGLANQVADALSHVFEADEDENSTTAFMTLSQPLVGLLDDLRQENGTLE